MSTGTTHSTPLTSENAALLFPALSPAQISRIGAHGLIRPITRGEVLIEAGQTNVPFFVVKAGEIEVIRPSGLGALLIAIVRANQFTGDISMILGRPAQMRLRVSESGEVVELTRDQMHGLIQTDAETSEMVMRTLIHRRIAMVAQGIGDALLIGSAQSGATLRIKAFLTRNDHPFQYLDLDRDADVRDLLDRFRVEPAELPVLICRGETVLSTVRGKMFSKRWFNECFREDADAIGAEIDGRKLNFHDMRGTVATNLASAGCTPFEIAAVIGWSLDKCQKIVDAYIATTGEMADAAFAKLEARKIEQARLAAIRTNEAIKKSAANSNEPVKARPAKVGSGG